MGGYGSNRWRNATTRAATGESFALATAALAPYMGEGNRAVTWTWSRGGRPIGSVRGLVNREEVRLWYTVTRAGGEREQVEDTLPLVWTPCTFGGARSWFMCPGCGTRRGVLFLPPAGTRFRCRVCHGLAYSTTRMDAFERATERIRIIQRRMGARGEYDPFAVPLPPPGMHARTYLRLVEQLHAAYLQRDALLVAEFQALSKRLERFTRREQTKSC